MNEVPPDDLPRSPTGRVPDWVLREAAGEPVDPIPFRPMPENLTRRRRRKRVTRALRAVLIVGLLAGLVALLAVFPSIDLPWAQTASGGSTASAGPPPGLEEGPRPDYLSEAPLHPAVSDGYAFIAMQPDGITPVFWSPCRPIHWVVRPDNMPIGGQTLVTEALDEVSRLSGLQFVYDGESDEAPSVDRTAYQPERYGDRWAPVLIVWATPAEVPDFGEDYLATAEPYMVATPSGDAAIVSGEIRLDSVKMNEAVIARHIDLVHSVLLHEIGHLVGLDHVTDPQQLMFPRAQLTLTELGRGDIQGLGFAGQGACQPDA